MNDPLGLIQSSLSGMRLASGGAAGIGHGVQGNSGGASSELAAKFRETLKQEVEAVQRLQQDAAASAERVRSSDDLLASLNAATRQADDALDTLMKLSGRVQAMRGFGQGRPAHLDLPG
jgi:ABC-type transporter Mla subunit MlaD